MIVPLIAEHLAMIFPLSSFFPVLPNFVLCLLQLQKQIVVDTDEEKEGWLLRFDHSFRH